MCLFLNENKATMSYITKLSLYPITNLSDARFAAAAGISYVGFCFDPNSPQFILPIKAKEILDWISGSHAIGYFGAQEVDEVLALSELLNMDVVALENNLLPDELPAIGKPIIKVIDVSHKDVNFISNEIAAYQQYADGFELKGVLPTSVSLDFIKDICAKHKVFLNLTLGSAIDRETLLNLAPYALVLAGGNEEKTGLKEYDELNDLLQLFTL
jgi:phosphoribosylanthranilate isomerase